MRVPDEREILERTVRAIADRARDAYRLVEEALEADSRDESGLAAAAKRLRMELLQTKTELERELGRVLLHCRRCNLRVHWVPGVGAEPGHWGHAEPASITCPTSTERDGAIAMRVSRSRSQGGNH
jgi:hypothetical protein